MGTLIIWIYNLLSRTLIGYFGGRLVAPALPEQLPGEGWAGRQGTLGRLDGIIDGRNEADDTPVLHDPPFRAGFDVVLFPHFGRDDDLALGERFDNGHCSLTSFDICLTSPDRSQQVSCSSGSDLDSIL